MKKNIKFLFLSIGISLLIGCGGSSTGNNEQANNPSHGNQQSPSQGDQNLPKDPVVNVEVVSDQVKKDHFLKFASTDYWNFARDGKLANVIFDPSASHDTGTGSAILEQSDTNWTKTDRLFSSLLLPVKPGETYTLSFWMKTDSMDPSLEVYGVFLGQNKNEIKNSRGSQIANSKKGTWEQGFIRINVPEDTNIKYFSFKVYMQHQGINGKIWVDDFDFQEGNQLPDRSAKKTFNGNVTKIDSLGNMQICENGACKDFFPMALVDVDGSRDLSVYASQGFNMKLNAWSAADVKNAYSAGLYTALNITLPMMYETSDIKDVTDRIDDILADPVAASKLLFYYADNEFYNRKQRVLDTIAAVRSRDNNSRPIYMLQGDYALTRKYNDLSDIAGAYVSTNKLVEASEPEMPSMYEYEIMDRMPNQNQPVIFAEITRGVKSKFRAVFFGAIAKGARGMAFWRDGGSTGDITKRVWWDDLPQMKTEIDKMMNAGIIQADHNPSFKAVANNKEIISGTRVVNGVGYIIAANPTDNDINVTFDIQNLGYAPSGLQDFIKDNPIGSISGAKVSFTVPKNGSRVVKLQQ